MWTWHHERNLLLERLENETMYVLMRFEEDARFVTAPNDDPVLMGVSNIANEERNQKKKRDRPLLDYSMPLFVTDRASFDIMQGRGERQVGAGLVGFVMLVCIGALLFLAGITVHDDAMEDFRERQRRAEREEADAAIRLAEMNDRQKHRRGRRRTKEKRRKHERRKKRKPATSDAPEVCCKVCSAENKNFDRLRCASCSHVLTDRLIKQTATAIEADEECVICLDEFVAGEDELMVLPCVHKLHFECGEEWLEQHSNCPICKTEIE